MFGKLLTPDSLVSLDTENDTLKVMLRDAN